MKFAKGGVIQEPVILGDDCVESLVPAESVNVENLRTALKLDLMLLELEESLENGAITISF